MRIHRLKLANFRRIANGEVVFPRHPVVMGGNSGGKSTLCEALNLLLGPGRLSRSSPVDEHDFFERRYIDDDANPILIELEVVLTDLTEDILTKFRIHEDDAEDVEPSGSERDHVRVLDRPGKTKTGYLMDDGARRTGVVYEYAPRRSGEKQIDGYASHNQLARSLRPEYSGLVRGYTRTASSP